MINRHKTTPQQHGPDGDAGRAAAEDDHQQELLDEALAETFPASDPVSTLSTGGGRRR